VHIIPLSEKNFTNFFRLVTFLILQDILKASKTSSDDVASLSNAPSPFSTAILKALISLPCLGSLMATIEIEEKTKSHAFKGFCLK
jgi:hypothetical protein